MHHLPVEIFDQIITCYEDSGDVSSSDWSVLAQVSKSFHARFVPSLFGIINEEQLRHPSFAQTLQQKPQYSAFVRAVAWQLIPFHEDDYTALETAHEDEVERLIALLSSFPALRVLSIIAGDTPGSYALERIPSLSQMEQLLPNRLEHLALSSPAEPYYMTLEMWTMLHWLASSGSAHTLQFTSDTIFHGHPPFLEWPTIKSLSIEKAAGNTGSDEQIGLLVSSCSSLQHFDFAFMQGCPDELGWFFEACIPDRPLRQQLKRLTLESFCVGNDDIAAPGLPLALPALEEFKLTCGPRDSTVDLAVALTNNLELLFPPLETAHNLKSLKLHYRAHVDRFFDPDFSSRNFDRFQDRTQYPALVDFTFSCQHIRPLNHADLNGGDEDGPQALHEVLREAVMSECRAVFKGLVAKAPHGMKLMYGLEEAVPKAFWSLRCHVGFGSIEENYRLEGDAAGKESFRSSESDA